MHPCPDRIIIGNLLMITNPFERKERRKRECRSISALDFRALVWQNPSITIRLILHNQKLLPCSVSAAIDSTVASIADILCT